MRLLCIDIGAGTQDILLLDTSEPVENAVQLILPAPTQLAAQKMEEATGHGEAVLLTGVNMGGGANTSALKRHLRAGLPAYATPDAARTFDDDLEVVSGWGVKLVSPDEAARLRDARRVELRDLDLDALRRGLAALGVDPRIDGLAVAVLDHGEAPPGVSDRLFRFEHLSRQVGQGGTLESLCYRWDALPPYLTRMKAVVGSAQGMPLVLADTGTAAALGAALDRRVARHPYRLSVNLGNQHALAFHLADSRILGLLEHHTGMLSPQHLRGLLERLLAGTLTNQEVWEEGGHGCLSLEKGEGKPFLVATGPRRALILKSRLRAYLAAPYGDMMLTGCYGLLKAWQARMEPGREEIAKALA